MTNKKPKKPTRANRMPKDFAKRVSQGLVFHHRNKKIRALEQEVLRLAAIWAAGHDGNWWFEGNAGALERAVVKLEVTKARAAK